MKLTTTLAAFAVALSGSAAFAQYPEKNIEVIIPYGPGSNTDIGGRLFMNAMSEALGGATMVPVNVAGAGGTIGTAQLAASSADGYVLGYNPIATVTIQPHLRPLPYGQDSFEPVCKVSDTPSAIMVAPDSPYKTVDDLVAAAKDGKVVAAGPAPGSLPFISQAAVAQAYGVNFKYLPLGGGGKAAASVLGGEATISADLYSAAEMRGLRMLGVLADERRPDAPDVPTFKELGHDLSLSVWFGLFAPKGTPSDVLDTLAAACEKAVQNQAFVDGMTAANYQIDYLNRSDFNDFYNGQFEDNKNLLSLIGLGK